MPSSSSSSSNTIENQTLTTVAETEPLVEKSLEKRRDGEAGAVGDKDQDTNSKALETKERRGPEGEETQGKEADVKQGGELGGGDETLEKDANGDEGSLNGEEEVEEGECGFCLFMKGGGCRESFIAWEKCVEEAEKSKEDIVDKCFEVTGLLKKCMDAHADYYGPVLQAEKAMVEEAARELAQEGASLEAAQ